MIGLNLENDRKQLEGEYRKSIPGKWSSMCKSPGGRKQDKNNALRGNNGLDQRDYDVL